MSASNRNRVRAGVTEGGQFATEARGEPTVNLGAAANSPHEHVRQVAGEAGWPVAADILIDLNERAEIHSDALAAADEDTIDQAGIAYVGPMIDGVESWLEREWDTAGGTDEGQVAELDMAALQRSSSTSQAPAYVPQLIEAAQDRGGDTPPGFVSSLSPAQLERLHREAIAPVADQWARDLRAQDRQRR